MSPNPACVNDTITFTVSGVVDSGGIKRIDCYSKTEVSPVAPTYTWVLTIPPDYPPPLPPLSGSGPTSSVVARAPGTYSCTFTATADRECPPPDRTIGPATATVADVVSVEWDEYVPESTPLDSCPNNGGKRMFPGKRYAVDPSWNIRNMVTLKAAISPAAEGCTVYFKVWDIDDPFDQNNPTMPNVSVIDGDTSGPDNRGSDPGVVSGSATTDANGEARFTITVSMQPGNNYRAGASTVQSALKGTTQAQADANTPPQYVLFTDMLTIWRKVWLELDSMGPGSDISYTGAIDEINNNTPHAGDGTAELHVPDINDEGRFEGGTMTVADTGNVYTIIDNVDVFVDDDYTMSTLIAAADLGKTAKVVDDDTAVLPKTPDANISVLDDKYRNCYIEFTENSATRDNNNVFVATLPYDGGVIATKGFENADLSPAPDFWLAIVVTCYQSYDGTDDIDENKSSVEGDPDATYHVHGASSSAGDISLILAASITGGSNVTVLYLETNIDYLGQVVAGFWPGHIPRTLAFKEPRTIAHEIGHQFGISVHTPGTLISPWDGRDLDLDADQIVFIRGSTHLGVN